ncbi:c-type cytochrome [Methylobacterium sp. A49B]|nr:c-type cytochrome [Parafilimonas terrae]
MSGRGMVLGTTVALCLLAKPAAAENVSAARGRDLAGVVCARCHAVRATDASRMREAPPFRALAGTFPIGDLADVLDEGVERRHPAMPDFRLSPRDAADLTAYIRTLRR